MSESNKPVFVERGSLAIGLLVKEFKKAQFLDVRNYYNAGGEWKPTAKGIMIPIEFGSEVLRVMEDLLDPIAPKRPSLKASKSKDVQAKPENVVLYLVSRSKPEFERGLIEFAGTRVFERSSSAKVNARNRTLKSHRSEPYKVFKYEGPKPSHVERTSGVYCVFEQDAGTNKISLYT